MRTPSRVGQRSCRLPRRVQYDRTGSVDNDGVTLLRPSAHAPTAFLAPRLHPTPVRGGVLSTGATRRPRWAGRAADTMARTMVRYPYHAPPAAAASLPSLSRTGGVVGRDEAVSVMAAAPPFHPPPLHHPFRSLCFLKRVVAAVVGATSQMHRPWRTSRVRTPSVSVWRAPPLRQRWRRYHCPPGAHRFP